MSEDYRVELFKYHRRMYRDGLVVGTQGNISVRTDGGMCIKPSGVDYEDLTSEDFVDVVKDGAIWRGTLKPSTDTASHLVIYRKLPWVQAIVHTHSTFATAFAACGMDIEPLCLTGMADEFGDKVPCSAYAEIGGEEIGEAIVALEYVTSPHTFLIRNHGLFALGSSVASAYKRALMAEDAARTVLYARQLGQPITLTALQAEKAYARYHSAYGQ